MPETVASPSSSSRNRPSKSKQYRCSLCDKPFDSDETLDLIGDLNTLNLAILNQLQGYADGMLTVVTRNIVR